MRVLIAVLSAGTNSDNGTRRIAFGSGVYNQASHYPRPDRPYGDRSRPQTVECGRFGQQQRGCDRPCRGESPASGRRAARTAGGGLCTARRRDLGRRQGRRHWFIAKDFVAIGNISLGDDADINIGVRNDLAVVAFGSGGLALIDPGSRALFGTISLSAHPEGSRPRRAVSNAAGDGPARAT